MKTLLLVLSLFSLPVAAAGVPAPEFALSQVDAAAPLPTLPTGVPSIEEAPLQFALVLVNLAQTGKWGPFGAFLVFALVALVRWGAKKLPADSKVALALTSKWGGWALNFASALAAGFGSVLYLGAPLSVTAIVGIVGAALTFTFGAAGVKELQKDLMTSRNDAASSAGSKASGEVKTLDEAAAVLRKGPPEA